MPTVVVETGSGTNPAANSYASVAQVNTYADESLGFSAWNAASADDKARAVISASRLIDKWFVFAGSPSLYTQPLSWPRVGTYTRQLDVIGPNTIPTLLVQAVAEMANALLEDPDLELAQETGLASFKAADVSMVFNGADRPSVLPPAVLTLLEPVSLPNLGSFAARTVRV